MTESLAALGKNIGRDAIAKVYFDNRRPLPRNLLNQYQPPNYAEFINSSSPLEFERRAVDPAQPVLKQGDGVATHMMSWNHINDGTAVVYPNVVKDPNNPSELIQLGGREAYDHAMKTGQYRTFTNPAEAQHYAEGGWKSVWPKEFKDKYGLK
jgi:hypothetical protein